MKKANFTNNQIPIDFSFVSEKTFDNFIHGNNEAIIKSLISFSDEDSTNIILIYGKKSSGKPYTRDGWRRITGPKGPASSFCFALSETYTVE